MTVRTATYTHGLRKDVSQLNPPELDSRLALRAPRSGFTVRRVGIIYVIHVFGGFVDGVWIFHGHNEWQAEGGGIKRYPNISLTGMQRIYDNLVSKKGPQT